MLAPAASASLRRLASPLLAALLTGCVHWAGELPRPPRWSADYAETGDGFHIRLDRYEPAVRAEAPPVLLVHGTCECGDAWRIGAGGGLAGYLAERGRDVWTMDMRAGGRSSRPSILGKLPSFWTIDAYLREDLPAAIGRVRERAGAERVSLVGHSLGGMLAYALVARDGDAAHVDRIATLGAPMGFGEAGLPWHVRLALDGFLAFAAALPPVRWSNCEPASDWGALWLRLFDPPGMGAVWNPDNVDRDVKSRFLAHGVGNTNPGAGETFARLAETGVFSGDDGLAYSSPEALGRVAVPALVVAGAADALAKPDMVRLGFERLGSKEKRYVLLGTAEGFSADYGHVDLLIGRDAPRDHFPLLAEFLGGRR